ncbi:MAG: hypothetical protein ACHQQ3_07740 [Gemmatimonadales bacterium]
MPATRVAAQDTTKAAKDSIAERLERAEEAIRLLQQQLAAQAQGGVQTRSRLSLEFSGRVLVTGFSNSRRVNNVDVPLFARPDTANGLPQGGAGMAIRQTTLGLAVTAPRILGGSFRGDVDVDFFGGQQPSSGGRTFPLLRLRTARGILTWKHGELLVGQESPLISGVNPVSLASVGTPGFVAAGNLWLWLPQVRAGVETGGPVSFGIQGAILAPTSGDPAAAFDTDNDVAEKSRRPFVQGRVHVRWGSDEMAGDIGVGVHRGWLAAKGDSLLVSEAFAVDARIPLTRWLEVRGEGYDGKALKGLGGGGIGQGLGQNGAPVRSRGAWGQVNLKPTSRVVLGAGYGFDDPRDEDLAAGSRLKNEATEVHLHVRPAGPLVLGFEYRRLETTYATGKLANDHLNLAIGFEF